MTGSNADRSNCRHKAVSWLRKDETAAFSSADVILIAIGANLAAKTGESALRNCRDAAESISAIPGLRLVSLSRWYATAPIPHSAQPDYVNGVALLAQVTSQIVTPEALLAQLHAIEARAGRERAAPNAARTLDLDLIAFGRLVRDAPDPVLPHPRAYQRAFVLQPIDDVAPNWVHPVLLKTAKALLATLPPQDIRPL